MTETGDHGGSDKLNFNVFYSGKTILSFWNLKLIKNAY